MKKILTLIFIFLIASAAIAENDYEAIYRELPVPDFSYIHDIDPGEYYDTKRSTWSPYPLFRLTTPLYFKTIKIEPGYYLLTPREQDGNWYILFKEAGRVKYIVPVYNRDLTPQVFYDENIPQPKRTFSQKLHINTLNFVGKTVPSSKRKPEPQNYLEATDLDNNFISLVLYWGSHRYFMVLRTIQL